MLRFVVFELVDGYDITYLHTRRTGHLTALAIEAVLQCVVEECRVLETVALTVGTGLLRTGIEGIDLHHRTYLSADIALLAIFEFG